LSGQEARIEIHIRMRILRKKIKGAKLNRVENSSKAPITIQYRFNKLSTTQRLFRNFKLRLNVGDPC
jgi:hypothetical protein